LENKSEDTSKMPKVQSDDQGVQSTKSGAGIGTVNSGLPRE